MPWPWRQRRGRGGSAVAVAAAPWQRRLRMRVRSMVKMAKFSRIVCNATALASPLLLACPVATPILQRGSPRRGRPVSHLCARSHVAVVGQRWLIR
jgi:hypothetical protein